MKPDDVDDVLALKYFFKAYIIDGSLREIIDGGNYAELNVNPSFSLSDFKSIFFW